MATEISNCAAPIEPSEIMTPKEQLHAFMYSHPGPLSPAAKRMMDDRIREALNRKAATIDKMVFAHFA